MSLEAGLQPIPGYRLTKPLGAGAFGEVWEARNENNGCVAMKFLDCRLRTPSMITNELRILRALAELKHPHIIPLIGVQACGKYMILIMEKADGNLADLHDAYSEATGGNVPPDHALELLEQAADALDFLASARLPGMATTRGLQHCDIKPTNLLLVGETLKVADFGLCTVAGAATHKSGWKGTIPYAAPEMYGGAGTVGTDQYALAVTFCELVMGARPFWPGALTGNAPTGLPIDLTKLRDKEFPIIARALHPYPSSRFPSCKAFVEALRKAVGQPRMPSPRLTARGAAGRRSSGRHRVLKTAGAVAAKARSNQAEALRPT